LLSFRCFHSRFIRIGRPNCDVVHLEPVVDGEEVVSVVVDDCSAEDDAIVQSETADVVDVVSVQSPQVHETVFGC